MGYTRDNDRATRGVGAIAAADMVSPSTRYRRVQVGRATRARDRLMSAVASGALGAINTETPDRRPPGGPRVPDRRPAPPAPTRSNPLPGVKGVRTLPPGSYSPTTPPPPAAVPPGFVPGTSTRPPGAIVRDHRTGGITTDPTIPPPPTPTTPTKPVPPGTVVAQPPVSSGGGGSGGGGVVTTSDGGRIVSGPGGQPIVIPPSPEIPDAEGMMIAGYPATTVLLVGGVAVLGAYLLLKDRSGS